MKGAELISPAQSSCPPVLPLCCLPLSLPHPISPPTTSLLLLLLLLPHTASFSHCRILPYNFLRSTLRCDTLTTHCKYFALSTIFPPFAPHHHSSSPVVSVSIPVENALPVIILPCLHLHPTSSSPSPWPTLQRRQPVTTTTTIHALHLTFPTRFLLLGEWNRPGDLESRVKGRVFGTNHLNRPSNCASIASMAISSDTATTDIPKLLLALSVAFALSALSLCPVSLAHPFA